MEKSQKIVKNKEVDSNIGIVKDIVLKVFWNPIKAHPAIVSFVFGILSLIIGGYFEKQLDAAIAPNTGKIVFNIGSGVIGAGIIALIIQTKTFVGVLKSHLYDVLYDPATVRTHHSLVDTWTTLTEKILESVLPITHTNAAQTIKDRFFNNEIEYHFEQYVVTYNIVVNKDESLEVKENVATTIYPSPHVDNPKLVQTSEVVGSTTTKELKLNGVSVDVGTVQTSHSSKNDPSVIKTKVEIELKKYINPNIKSTLSQEMIKYERIDEYRQKCLNDEPYIIGDINRYTKGYEVRAKITEGYNLFFEALGGASHIEDISEKMAVNGNGYCCWTIAKLGETLLPGSGFIIVIAKK